MSNLFGDTRRQDDIVAEVDTLGGFQRLESNIYDFTVEMAYALQSESGARGIAFTLTGADGQSLKENMYVTSGTAKGGTNYYTDRNGRRQYLMGFTLANDICIAITGKELADMAGTEKDVKVTNWVDDAPVDAIEKKQVLMDLIGGRISVGVLKSMEDGYPDETVSRERNVIDKIFTYGSRLTIVEKEAGLEVGNFADKWLERNLGKLVDRRKASKNSSPVGGTAGAPSAAAAGAPTTTPKLFT